MPFIIKNSTICVRRGSPSGLADAVSVESEIDVSALKLNQVVLLVEKFGFRFVPSARLMYARVLMEHFLSSANNVTYGMLGEHEHFRRVVREW